MTVVSVVLPTFNRLRFLRPAVESVIAQTYRDWRLVIADDGSGDDTRAYLRSLGDPRIEVIWLPHTGSPATTRNAAVRRAAGDYIAFLDSDELWLADKLRLQVQLLSEHPERRWGYCGYSRIDGVGRTRTYPSSKPWTPYDGSIFARIVRLEAQIVAATVIAERALILAAGAFDESLLVHEDYDLWARLALHSDIGVVNAPLVAMRTHDEHHGTGGLRALENRQRSLTKLGRLVANTRNAPVLYEALTENTLRLARSYAGTDRRSALRALGSGLPLFVRQPRKWPALVGICAKVIIPRPLLALLRRIRSRLHALRRA
jgi:glycosyltransferase involved in cell wall biosynthesis